MSLYSIISRGFWKFIAYFSVVQGKNTTDLLKTYGPDKDTLLMTLCCYKNDSPSLRAQIYAFISRVLEEANEAGIGKYMKKKL